LKQVELEGRQATLRNARWRVELLQNPLWIRSFSLVTILMAWILFSQLLGPRILPGPLATLEFAVRQFERGALTFHIWATIQRVLVAFSIGMLLGVMIGVAMGASRWFDRLFEMWLVVGLTIPRIVLFVMAYLILGLNEFAIIIALIVTIIPTIIVQIREGTQALDRKLIEMAQAYRRSRLAIWRKVVFPQLLPYVIGTARSSLSIAWRLVVLGELLGRTSGVGYQIQFYFQMFNMTGILAYGVTMMLVLAVIDIGLMSSLQRYAFRWRRPI
jgi:NitT/TauT family transport system permease protein